MTDTSDGRIVPPPVPPLQPTPPLQFPPPPKLTFQPGTTPVVHPHTANDQQAAYRKTMRDGLIWIGCCLLVALVFGLTITGPMVILEFPLILIACGLATFVGVRGIVPVVWALPFLPLCLMLIGSGSDYDTWNGPNPATGIAYVLLTQTYTLIISRRSKLDIAEATRAGRPPSAASRRRRDRLGLTIPIGAYFAASLTMRIDILGLLLLAAGIAMIWRKSWTAALALVMSLFTLAVAGLWDGLHNQRPDRAHLLTLTAGCVYWAWAIFAPSWRKSLLSTVTDTIDGLRGRLP